MAFHHLAATLHNVLASLYYGHVRTAGKVARRKQACGACAYDDHFTFRDNDSFFIAWLTLR
jgi:hypothetical protein